MRSKVTVVLLFLNVVLFAYIYWFETVKPLNVNGNRVLGPETATIESLTRTNRTGETVKIEKRVDSWWLTAPYEWPADRNAVAGLLNTLQLLEHDTSFPVAELASSGRSLADYGLAEPAVTLAFTSAGQTYTLQIGDTTQVGNRLYILSSDHTRIHVVSRSLAETIGLPLDTLRAPTIFSVPVFEVRSLNVQTAAPANLKVRLRRDAAARWDFEAPIRARASKAAVEVTINQVNALTARNFLEPRDTDLDRAGLNSPSWRVTLEGNARRETLLLGNATGVTVPREGAAPDAEYFAKIEDKAVVFTTAVPADLLAKLRATQEELRDPRVLDFEPATVTALTLVAPGQPELALQKLEGDQGWQVVVRVSGSAPQTMAADPGVVTTLLQKVAFLTAREARPGSPRFLSDAPSDTDKENWGFNRPAREVTLSLNTGGGPSGKEPTTVKLEIGVSPDKPGEAFARTANAPFVYQVLPDILDDTPVAARHYRLRVLRELPAAARITRLKLSELPADTALFTVANEIALTPETLATDKLPEKARTVLARLLGQVRLLRVKAFAAGPFTPDHAEAPAGPQPWKYRLDVDIAFPGASGSAPNSTTTLYLTDRLGGTTQLAGTAEFGGVVFEVTQEMLDTLFALTYKDPGPLPGDRPGQTPAGQQAGTVPTAPAKEAAAPAAPPKAEPPPKT